MAENELHSKLITSLKVQDGDQLAKTLERVIASAPDTGDFLIHFGEFIIARSDDDVTIVDPQNIPASLKDAVVSFQVDFPDGDQGEVKGVDSKDREEPSFRVNTRTREGVTHRLVFPWLAALNGPDLDNVIDRLEQLNRRALKLRASISNTLEALDNK